ncbi:MAG: 2-succinyl-5-enolpyruvyl-6-hydroxy-3-cyclohexene-1-carboxylic-acid synthase [Candidatus Nanopelagicales bacterium]|nr:2-succinyl-5-enolpyruvyl-6-hydroxy-3-cyclohexene-1-carboxylic-acid synthase [Candidatus Nanopelagicales bacterium]
MNPSTAMARVIIDELVRCGITDVVLAPGSRSAALALELAAAEGRGELTLHVRVDERSAAFLALGLGKVSGVPAVVVTTSGTAAVNLHPAVVEADLASVPLIALTADRPAALRGVGANQTIEQVGLFGPSVRASVDLAPAVAPAEGESFSAQSRVWRSTVARAVAATTDVMRSGPVHLNVQFVEPLVPAADDADPQVQREALASGPLAGRPDGRPWTADARLMAGMGLPIDEILEMLLDDASIPERGLIVVGDHADGEAAELVDELGDALGWPIIGEPSGNVSACDTSLAHGALLLGIPGFADAHVPDVVITVGRVGLSRAVQRHILRARVHIAVDAQPQWSDPTRSADVVVAACPLPPAEGEIGSEWLESWQRADLLAAAAIETVLAGGEVPELTGMHVARACGQAVPEEGLFFVGPSWPVRHVYNFAANATGSAVTLCNRGTSGIDGCVSTAWGSAVAAQRDSEAACIALLGDLTFLYDLNGLRVPTGEELPDLVYVVSDNNGGGIFSQLEQGGEQFAPVFDRVFGTPLEADIPAAVSALGFPCATASTSAELDAALRDALQAGGVQVVVARTCTRTRESEILGLVNQAVDQALATA